MIIVVRSQPSVVNRGQPRFASALLDVFYDKPPAVGRQIQAALLQYAPLSVAQGQIRAFWADHFHRCTDYLGGACFIGRG